MTRRPISRRRRDPSQEYVILIGAPSNTFNGYFRTTDFSHAQPPPVDASDAAITAYLRGDGTLPLPTTHDLYWANFIYSAVKMVETGVVRPGRGDILTFMLWRGGLAGRIQTDWLASPYNVALHASSPWVAARTPYDRLYRAAEQGMMAPPPPHVVPDPAGPIIRGTDHPRINHEILMRTTSETGPDGGFHKRPHEWDDWERAIADIPRRLVLGWRWNQYPPVVGKVPPLPEVQVKLLIVDTYYEFFDYVKLGQWPNGTRWMHWADIADETQMGQLRPMADCNWSAYAKTARGRSYPGWSATPSVDRSLVKIKRFDYFGHSGPGHDRQSSDVAAT
jgi:hypothetical protein